MNPTLTHLIPETDWKATPATVKSVLLSLEQERDLLQERVERLEQGQNTEGIRHKERLERYHTLVEQQFLSGLTPEQQQEIEQLGREIDAVNSAFYPSLNSLSETIATGVPEKDTHYAEIAPEPHDASSTKRFSLVRVVEEGLAQRLVKTIL